MCLGLRSWGWREEHIAQHQAADGYTATTETLFSLITAKHCENTHRSSTSVPASFFCPPLQVLAVLGTQRRSKCVTAAKASRWKCRLRQHLLSLRTPWGFEWPEGLKSNRNRDYHELKIPPLHIFILFSGIFFVMLLMIDIKQVCDVLLAGWRKTSKFTFLPLWLPKLHSNVFSIRKLYL